MKRILSLCFLLAFLCGCTQEDKNISAALQFRERLLQSQGCAFEVHITADYGDQLHQFQVDCQADSQGNVRFTVKAPESISGITGEILASGGRLTFDDIVLGFPFLADGMLSPVSAPWILLQTLRGGYLATCGGTEEGMRLTMHDSYAEDALQLDVWTDRQCIPYHAEILWRGRRILTLEIENFQVL